MRSILARRSAAFAGTVCALLLGMSGVANADDPIIPPPNPIYSNAGPVNVRVTGGGALALNQCLADMRDGVINTAIDQCNQIPTAGNYLELQDVNVTVYAYNTWGLSYLYRGKSVDALIWGGSVSAILGCLADAQDGMIYTPMMMECSQIPPVAGNMIMLSDVGIAVYE